MAYRKIIGKLGLIGLLLVLPVFFVGCGQTAEKAKPLERWQIVAEKEAVRYVLDMHSIVKMQTEKATASVTDTIKRDVVSFWVKIEPVPGKEEEYAKKYGKDIQYGMLFMRIDKLNKEFMAVETLEYFKDKNKDPKQNKEPMPQFGPYQPDSVIDKIAQKL